MASHLMYFRTVNKTQSVMAYEVRQNPTLFSRKIEEISRVRQKRASRRKISLLKLLKLKMRVNLFIYEFPQIFLALVSDRYIKFGFRPIVINVLTY